MEFQHFQLEGTKMIIHNLQKLFFIKFIKYLSIPPPSFPYLRGCHLAGHSRWPASHRFRTTGGNEEQRTGHKETRI